MSTGPGLGAPGLAKDPQTSGPVGLQTLLDLLVGVYQEFYSSTLVKEKFVSGFLQWGESFSPRLLNINVGGRNTTLLSFSPGRIR